MMAVLESLDMQLVERLCSEGKWERLEASIRNEPRIAKTSFAMGKKFKQTSIIHQALYSKDDKEDQRVSLIRTIIELAPEALKIPNKDGMLPLQRICYTNVKIEAKTRAELIIAIMNAYPKALLHRGGEKKRTLLHTILLRRNKASLVSQLITKSPRSIFLLKDGTGWLPIHVACKNACTSRYCGCFSMEAPNLYTL